MAHKSFVSGYKDAWTRKHGEGTDGTLTFLVTGMLTVALTVLGGVGYTAFLAEDEGGSGKVAAEQEKQEVLKSVSNLEKLIAEKQALETFAIASGSPHLQKILGKPDQKKTELATAEVIKLEAQLQKESRALAEKILTSETLSEADTKDLLFKGDYGVMPAEYAQKWQGPFNEKHATMIQECRIQFRGVPAETAVPGILACAEAEALDTVFFTPIKYGIAGWLTASLGIPFLTAAGAHTRRRREEKTKDVVQQTVSIKISHEP